MRKAVCGTALVMPAFTAALRIALLGLSACGGGSSAPPPQADFAISVTPSSASTQVGGSTGAVAVSLTPLNGFIGSVTLNVNGLPNGISSSPATPLTLSPGAAQSFTFSAPAAAGTFTVDFSAASGALAHSTSVMLRVIPPPSPFLISASYYPWYNSAAWQYTECYNGFLRGDLVPEESPALGQYDSQQQDVVTQQIAWSTAAGINVWDIEWVMPNDLLDNTIRQTILTNAHIGDIRFAMFYDYAIRFNSDFTLTPDKIQTIVSDFKYFAAHYFTHPSYLKVGQGQPVVFFYAALNLTPVSAVQSMVATLRQAMTAAGFSVYLIGDEYYPLLPPDPARIENWDAIFGYNPYASQGGYADDNGFLALHATRYQQYQAVAQQLGVDFVPSVVPGFNDRAVRRTCANNAALARRTNPNAAEGSLFAGFLQQLAFPYATNSKLKMIHITSFNEWHEDTMIEPTVVTDVTTRDTSSSGSQYTQELIYQGYGTTYLDIVRNQIAAAK